MGIRVKQKDQGGDNQKSPPFLHTFDILERNAGSQDNENRNTKMYEFKQEEWLWQKQKRSRRSFRNTEPL